MKGVRPATNITWFQAQAACRLAGKHLATDEEWLAAASGTPDPAMGNDGTNLRVNVDDGKVTTDGSHKFADADMHKGEKPNIVAGAYTNSVKGAKETALFNIDATIGGLIKQAPPNDGVLGAIGKLGIKADSVAFDIWSDGAGKNEAWLMADGTLYSVDLATGKATEAAKISGVSGTVKDIAIMGM